MSQDPGLPVQILCPLEGGGWIELGRGQTGSNGTSPETVQRLDKDARLTACCQSGAGTENKR